MNNTFKKAAAVFCAALCATACAGCGSSNADGKASQLGSPKQSVRLSYEQKTDADFVSFVKNVDNFSSEFAAEAVNASEKNNFSVSPISAYTALALSAECAAGETRGEVLSALGTDYEKLTANFCNLFNLLNVENTVEDGVVSRLNLTNSVWVNEGTQVKNGCISNLSDKFYAYSYGAPFYSDNAAANKAVRDFVKKQTNGLIDCDFKISPETAFTLINTLYLKDVWNFGGRDLRLTDEVQIFTNGDGSKKKTKLLLGNYRAGRVRQFEGFKSFYAQTENGYNLKFILPDEGKSVREIFTAENIRAVNSVNFSDNAIDGEQKIKYSTRCIFPEFSTACDCELSGLLSEKFGVKKLFSASECDFSNLTDGGAYCSKVRHVTKLKVDKKGVEGAAVTVMDVAGSAAPQYKDVYQDFYIDRAFGFVLTDGNGVELFAGVADKI